MALIDFTDKGLYCSQGDFFIDPWKPVNKAIITHAHSDHARSGSQQYLCHHLTKPLLQLRLGDHFYQSVDWNEAVYMNGVKISLHPSGHIIGAAQIRVEYNDEVWVVSGDYKTEDDGISGAFEPVKCNTFITESTFGLPIYRWKKQAEIFAGIQQWVEENHAVNKTSDLSLVDLKDIGLHYGNTLAIWHKEFNNRLTEVKKLGFDDYFIRKWNYYLCYCEAAFAMRHINVMQMVYSRPNNTQR